MKKPVVIEATQFDGDNYKEILDFTNGKAHITAAPGCKIRILISTLEGTMEVSVKDYVIKGIDGEFYPCKPSIFERTYDIV